jgi:hypothetical protein
MYEICEQMSLIDIQKYKTHVHMYKIRCTNVYHSYTDIHKGYIYMDYKYLD